MEEGAMFVRPVDVFASNTDMGQKSPIFVRPSITRADSDEMFVRYESSPESMTSFNDDNTFSPVEEENHLTGRDLLDMVWQYMSPYQDQLDPFITFPIALDRFQEGLISTYLTDYSETFYQFSPSLRPHPIAAVLSVALTNPAAFHLVLARSAQYRQSWNTFNSKEEQRKLALAVMKHKGEAIQTIRNLSHVAAQGRRIEDLIAAITSLGMFDQYSGADDTASMHFGAVRRLLKTAGGPLKIRSLMLSRAMIHFECFSAVSTQSYVWDRSDFSVLHQDLNHFFCKIWAIQRGAAAKYGERERRLSGTAGYRPSPDSSSSLSLKRDSLLYHCLSRRADNSLEPTVQERLDLLHQLNCLFILCNIIIDHQTDTSTAHAYIESVHDLIEASQLQGQPCNNVMWLLQVHDQSKPHSKRIWDAAGWAWILRHVSFNVQSMVKDWLMAILTDKPVARALKLDAFAFSYAS